MSGEEQAPSRDSESKPFRVLEANRETVQTVETPLGPVTYIVNRGGRDRQEDRIILLVENHAGLDVVGFASVDGMGGSDHGAIAARLLAQELLTALSDGEFQAAQERAHERMKFVMPPFQTCGACYAAVTVGLLPDTVFSSHAGDVRTLILDPEKIPDDATKDHDYAHSPDPKHQLLANEKPATVTNAVTDKSSGEAIIKPFSVKVGDWIICASDGLWDNLGETIPQQSDKAAELIRHAQTPTEATQILYDYITQKMQREAVRRQQDQNWDARGKEQLAKLDNISIIVMRIDQLPAKET